jgi:diacylglycerol kinase family enzyme
MNPRSGGGKVGRFGLAERARALGAEVSVLDGPGTVDVAALARQAVDDGADLLGVAGGDGTQALVAGIAAAAGVPFLVISAGTRNHFALDLGLDREDPVRCLDALTDGVEIRVDLGTIGERTFVNNASFGAYAQVVQSPAYRDDKMGTALDMLPALLAKEAEPRLRARAGASVIEAPQALLVSNNPYALNDIAGLGRRSRLDGGVLGVLGVRVANSAQAVGLLRGRHSTGLRLVLAPDVVIEADAPTVPVGVDGEALILPAPVRCAIRPGALRVRVPRDRPGVPPPAPQVSWARLFRLAGQRS